MTTCPYTCAFFDYGGVLAEEGFKHTLFAMAEQYGHDPHTLWMTSLKLIWETGYVMGKCDEAAFWSLFKTRTGLIGDEAAWRRAMEDAFVLRPFMLDVVDNLRRLGVRTAVLSDQTDWLAALDARQGFSKHFEKVFNSYHYGVTKQELAFFRTALSEMGVTARESLFVDDNAGNVERARSLGITAILYETRDGFERDLAGICPALAAKGR